MMKNAKQSRRTYPSDMTDAQWEVIQPLLPPPSKRGQPMKHTYRELLDAMFYCVRTSCPWRYLPSDYPPWGTVTWWYRKWRIAGVFQQVHDKLVPKVRTAAGREPTPSAAAIDSQSVKTDEKGGPASRATTRARKSKGASAT